MVWKEIDGIKTLVFKEEGSPWGEYYDGRFGYIVAGHHAQKDGIAKYYSHCVNIDTACYHTGKLSAQTFTADGNLDELIQVTGKPLKQGFKPTKN